MNNFRRILVAWQCQPATFQEAYAEVFHLGEGYLQLENEAPGKFKGNPVIIGHNDGRMHRKILFEDTFFDVLAEFQAMEWAFLSGCSYFGRVNSAERQNKLFALIFDIDDVTANTLNNFLSGAIDGGIYPIPNFIVESGHGIHLYYVLEEPLSLFPHIKNQVKNLKYYLTRRMWNRYTSRIKDPQYQGINQAFRIVGGKTKEDAPIARTRAWRVRTAPFTIEELNEYAEPEYQVDTGRLFPRTQYTLEQAKEKFPDWYARVIEGGGERGQWQAKEDLYYWWLNKLTAGNASYGHRYFAVMSLAIYAAKCGIYDRERVRNDAIKLIPILTRANPANPFTETDIDSALDCLDSRYTTFPRHDIEKLTAINITPNKRNGREQSKHLQIARFARDLNYSEENGWRNNNGAPEKKRIVYEWRRKNPDGRKIDCERETGVSRPTVLKWWGWEPPKFVKPPKPPLPKLK